MATLFNVYENESCEKLVLTASLEVIAGIFRLHADAVGRVEREVASGAPYSTLFFNSRPNNLGLNKIVLVANGEK